MLKVKDVSRHMEGDDLTGALTRDLVAARVPGDQHTTVFRDIALAHQSPARSNVFETDRQFQQGLTTSEVERS